jgi:hypothetical protein
MSTNIDDIPDPHIATTTPQVDLHKKSFNTNITSNIATTQPPPTSLVMDNSNTDQHYSNKQIAQDQIAPHQHTKNLYHTILSETNLLVFVVIILASLPHGNTLIHKMIPNSFHNSIVINIIKAIILFLLYILIIQFIL